MLTTFNDGKCHSFLFSRASVALSDGAAATAHATLVQPNHLRAAGCVAVPDTGLMPNDNTAPPGSAKRRWARPLDVAVLSGLAGGPIGADVVAAPWAVGLGPSGALADPARSARPPVTSHSTGHGLVHEQGRPVFVEGGKNGWRLNYQQASGIPWGVGHWPFLPLVGLGGQIKYYTSHLTTVCGQLPRAQATRLAERMDTWWWPTLHRFGLDLGPFKLALPEAQPLAPLTWLHPGDAADITLCRHRFWGVGLVLEWLRIGPQWVGQNGVTLRIERNVEDQARVQLAFERYQSARRTPLMLDLPVLALMTFDSNTQQVQRYRWDLHLHQAVGALAYRLLVDSYLRGEGPPALPGALATAGSAHESHSHGAEATLFLPWTLLQRHVRGLGALREWGTASVRHRDVQTQGHSLWVEGEVETITGGHDAYRIGLHGGGVQGAERTIAVLHLGVRLHVERLRQPRLRQLLNVLGQSKPAAAATVQACGRDARIHLNYAFDVSLLWRARRLFMPPEVRLAAQVLNLTVSDLQELARGMAQTLEGLAYSDDPLQAARGQSLLLRHGPEACVLVGRWLCAPEAQGIEVNYGETQQLMADMMEQAALGPKGLRAQGGATASSFWRGARTLGLWDRYVQEQQWLQQDALLALCGADYVAQKIQALRYAAERLERALPKPNSASIAQVVGHGVGL